MHEFDKCVIASKSGAKLAVGSVVNFDNGTVKIGIKDGCSLSPSDNVNLFIYNSVKGECVYSAIVESAAAETAVLKNVSFIRSTQKRDNTRADVILHYKITHEFSESGLEKLKKPIEITILNISAKGMYIKCEELFALGHRFPLTFTDAGNPINLNVEVVRCAKTHKGNKYGCRFINISEKDADNIYRFVLHEQIQQSRRRKFI